MKSSSVPCMTSSGPMNIYSHHCSRATQLRLIFGLLDGGVIFGE